MNGWRLGFLKLAFVAMALFLTIGSTSQTSRTPGEALNSDLSFDKPAPDSRFIEDLPLYFEVNKGQVDPKVKLLSRGTRSTIYLTPSEVLMQLNAPRALKNEKTGMTSAVADSGRRQGSVPAVLRMKFAGGNRYPEVLGEEQLPGKSNYFIGSDAKNWRTNVPQFARCCYKDVYPGVDVVFYGNQRKLEFDFIVEPGSDSNSIRLAFEGAKTLEIDGRGDLVAALSEGEVRFHKPYVYQGTKSAGEEIDGRFIELGRSRVGFEVGEYDPTRPLIIDPTLSYSTLIGGSSGASCNACVEDDTGNIYFGGPAGDGMFTVDPYQASYGGGLSDAYVGKLNSAGTAVVYATYLGGSGRDEFCDIAVDKNGNAYVIGATDSTNFPLVNPLQPTFGGSSIGLGDAFVTKLNSDGSALLYSTYLGGSKDEQG